VIYSHAAKVMDTASPFKAAARMEIPD